MKIKNRFIVMIMMLSLVVTMFDVPITAVAEDNAENYIYEDFENGIPNNITLTNATVSSAHNGVDSKECARVSVLRNQGSPYFPIKLQKDTTYNMSVYIKMINALALKNISNVAQGASTTFYFYLKIPVIDENGTETDGYETTFVPCTNIAYSTDEFNKYSAEYTYTGTVNNKLCGENAFLYLRISQGNRQQQGQLYQTMDYYMDNLIMENRSSDTNVFRGDEYTVSAPSHFERGTTAEVTFNSDIEFSEYYYEVSRVIGDNYFTNVSGCTHGKSIQYVPIAEDVGHELLFRIRPIESDGTMGLSFKYTSPMVADGSGTDIIDYQTNSFTNPYFFSENFLTATPEKLGVRGSLTNISHIDANNSGNGTSAVRVDVSTDNSGPAMLFSPIKGEQYKVGVWIKPLDNFAVSSVGFYFFCYDSEKPQYTYGNNDCYFLNKVRAVDLKKDEWTYVEDYFTWPETVTSSDGTVHNIIEKCTAHILIDDGIISNITPNQSSYSYMIDNFQIMPEEYEAYCSISGVSTENETLTVNCTSDKQTKKYYYTISHYGDDAVIDCGYTDGKINYTLTDSDVGHKMKFKVLPISPNGSSGTEAIVNSDAVIQRQSETKYRMSNKFIEDDMISFDGAIEYTNNADSKIVDFYVASYSDNASSEKIIKTEENLNKYQCGNAPFDIGINSTVNTIKAFVWSNDMTPASYNGTVSRRDENTMAIYVDGSYSGDDEDGSYSKPYNTISKAKDACKALLNVGYEKIYILIAGGEYFLDTPLQFDSSDTSENTQIIYEPINDEKVSVSGGIHVQNEWELFNSAKDIYRVYVGENINTRQMFVDGVRATRARSDKGLTNLEITDTGYLCDNVELASYEHPEDMEFVYYVQWTNSRCPIDTITESNGRAVINAKALAWTNLCNKSNDSLQVDYIKDGVLINKPDYYENAYELIDKCGEWYLNTHDGYLYYKPRVGEDISTADVVLPVKEKLVTMAGSNEAVKNVMFRNIDFCNTTWMRPSSDSGHSDAQNNWIREPGVSDYLPNGAIEIAYAQNIDFINCAFENIGITALKMTDGITKCDIVGCEFSEVSGSAITVGEPIGTNDTVYNPTTDRYMMSDINITDNYLNKIGVDFNSASAITVGFVKNTNICHNEIANTNYSGVHVGSGGVKAMVLTKNLRIDYNYIHDIMCSKIHDGGAVYSIGSTAGTAEEPNTMNYNYVKNINNYQTGFYPDETSSNWYVCNNVADFTKTKNYMNDDVIIDFDSRYISLHKKTITNVYASDIYTTTKNLLANGTNCTIENIHINKYAHWNNEAQDIIINSGIRKEFAKSGINTYFSGERK